MIKTKVEIITPVHIGTGENKIAFEYNYRVDSHICEHYEIKDIFLMIPSKDLLDEKFLTDLTKLKNNRSNKEIINSKIKGNVDYTKFTKNYQLNIDMQKDNYYLNKKDVAEQIKNLNTPIIPGSTIKGAIFNAIEYEILRQYFPQIKEKLKSNNSYQVKNIEDIYKMLFPFQQGNEINIINFIKIMRSCLICRDIPFKEMRLVAAERPKINDIEVSSMTLTHFETIDYGQCEIGDFIIIDRKKLKMLTSKYINEPYYIQIIKFLNYNNIQIACRNYFKAMIKEELNVNDKYQNYSLLQIDEALKKLLEIDKGCYIRIGKNTNYFFKTISYLFKTRYPDYYERNFEKIFSPVKLKKGRAHPIYDKMPITRTYYYDDNYIYYPGVIKIEFINEN